MERQYDLLGIPKSSKIKNRIALNQLYKVSNLSMKEQKEFSEKVDKIYLIAEINNRNCNYDIFHNEDYRFETIQIVYINLIKDNFMEEIDNIMHRLFPNPIIIIYNYNDKNSYSSSLKRINKVDNTKVVVEEICNSTLNVQDNFYIIMKQIFNSKGIKNLFELYKKIDNSIYYQMLYQTTEKFEYSLTIEEIKLKYKHISNLKKENRQLQNLYNSEKNKAKQMELFMKIKTNTNLIDQLIKEIEV